MTKSIPFAKIGYWWGFKIIESDMLVRPVHALVHEDVEWEWLQNLLESDWVRKQLNWNPCNKWDQYITHYVPDTGVIVARDAEVIIVHPASKQALFDFLSVADSKSVVDLNPRS